MKAMPWIAAQGSFPSEEAFREARTFAASRKDSRYIAFHTDRFSAGWETALQDELTDSLLELRLFTDSAELRLFRTAISHPFQLRVADDCALKSNLEKLESEDSFLKKAENYVHTVYQVLDINQKWAPYVNKERDAKGCRLLCTTGGGHYALPLQGEETLARVVNYLTYDEKTGVCSAADYRLAGFEEREGANEL